MGEMTRPSACVLIIDDDPSIRRGLALVLEGEGYEIVSAVQSREALDLLQGGLRPCMILLDLAMPEMSGWEFLNTLQDDPDLKTIPVVTLSAYGDVAPQEAPALGIAASFEKPVSVERLLTTVRDLCKH